MCQLKGSDPEARRALLRPCRTEALVRSGKVPDVSMADCQRNYKKALEKGVLKILSKMGISLLSCYHGAQIFEIYGLGKEARRPPPPLLLPSSAGPAAWRLAASCMARSDAPWESLWWGSLVGWKARAAHASELPCAWLDTWSVSSQGCCGELKSDAHAIPGPRLWTWHSRGA